MSGRGIRKLAWALHKAVKENQLEIAKKLIHSGVQVDERDDVSMTF